MGDAETSSDHNRAPVVERPADERLSEHAVSVASGKSSRRDGRISAVVFSRNEADLLADCLPRLHEFDELVVCDMESSDETVSVARNQGARVIPVPFAPVVEAVRQVAIDGLETEWVFFVDADELVPSGFRSTLELDRLPENVAAVRIRYDNAAFGTRLSHVLQGMAKYSMMRCDLARYEDHRAHAPPTFAGRVVDAPAQVPAILHMNFRTVSQSFEKHIRYAQSDPRDAAVFADPLRLARELTRDILAGAWRDGRAGVVVTTMSAVGRWYAATLAWEQQGYPDPALPARRRRTLTAADGVRRSRLWAARWIRRFRGRSRSA